jgi:hypothetical protein
MLVPPSRFNLTIPCNMYKRVGMETAFAKWLLARGETCNSFATRNRMNRERVRLLAGVGRAPKSVVRWNMPSLTTISEVTGISITVLIEDATRAASNPIPPRQYNRKGTDDGKATAVE